MGKSEELINNTILFAIGQFASKIFVLLLVPLYTYAMNSEQFGTADLFQNTLNLIIPVLTLGMIQSTMRFAMEKDIKREEVLQTAIKTVLAGSAFLTLLCPFIDMIKIFQGFAYYLPFMFMISSLQSIFLQFSRGIGLIRLYIKGSICCSVMLFAASIILILYLKLNIHGYLLAYIVANAASLLYLIFRGKLYSYLKFSKSNFITAGMMFKYGIPLVPNSLSWWVTLLSDRYFIIAFWGTALNGMYSVAAKIPSAMGVLIGIFIQSWQLTAVKEFNENSKSAFFDEVYQKYCSVTFAAGAVIISFTKIISNIMFLNEFYESWKYIPIMMCAATISNIQKYFGAIYAAAMKTNKVFLTSLCGAVVNITMNFILIPFFGAYGAAVSTYISYICVFVYRIMDTKKYIEIDIKIMRSAALIVLITVQAVFMMIDEKIFTMLSLLCAFIIIAVNYKELKELLIYLYNHCMTKVKFRG